MIERALPQLLKEHVHIDRWERPFAIITLLAVLTPFPPGPVYLDEDNLREMLDRGDDAHYDRKVMKRLAERDRVLVCFKGRPAAWTIDIRSAASEHWLNVPWKTSRRRFARELKKILADEAGNPQPPKGEPADEGTKIEVTPVQRGTPSPDGAALTDRPFVAEGYPFVADEPQNERSGGTPAPSEGVEPYTMPLISKEIEEGSRALNPSSSSLMEEEEGRVPETVRGQKLGHIIAAGCDDHPERTRLWGTPLWIVERVLSKYPDRMEELEELASRVAGNINDPKERARQFRSDVEDLAVNDWVLTIDNTRLTTLEKRARALRSFIATATKEVPDETDYLAGLWAELADIEAELGSPPCRTAGAPLRQTGAGANDAGSPFGGPLTSTAAK